MNIEHIEKLAEEAYDARAAAVIEEIKGLGRDCMLSGDDSPYQNVWQEYAAQTQEGESYYWEAYEETVRQFCSAHVAKLSQTELRLLWFFTDQGREWTFDIDYDKEHNIEPDEDEAPEPASFDPEDVSNEIYRRVYNIAEYEEIPSSCEADAEEDTDEDPLEAAPPAVAVSGVTPFTGELPLFD